MILQILFHTLHGMKGDIYIYTRWYQKVPGLFIAVMASVKEDERGGQGHTFASLLHQSAT
jgi:hypothetical protein